MASGEGKERPQTMMRALSNAEFLTLLENGHRLHPLDRGLLAIAVSFPEAGESVADWSLGRRNAALAELRALYFGPQLQGWTACERCGEKLEFEVDCRTLASRQQEFSADSVVVHGSRFRLPTSRDLARIFTQPDTKKAAMQLVEDCRIDRVDPAKDLSPEYIEEVGEKMAVADPLAEIALGFECPACHASSEELLDFPSFLWAELEARGRRLLIEIHTLARAYGWGEPQILALSDYRRAAYLQMVQA